MAAEQMPEITDSVLVMSNTLTVDPKDREKYLEELRLVLPEARKLPGCLVLEAGEVTDMPGTFVLYERWRSGTEYVGEYLQLPFYQRYLQQSEPLYSAPRSVVVLSSVV
ncbi:putative quinol monooxygenase [Agreia sp.]|uniref:putative quinol monooxygenase n=1 Tax=Agreia sp. TaxID=1872416 RepID=UPI0035BBEE2C